MGHSQQGRRQHGILFKRLVPRHSHLHVLWIQSSPSGWVWVRIARLCQAGHGLLLVSVRLGMECFSSSLSGWAWVAARLCQAGHGLLLVSVRLGMGCCSSLSGWAWDALACLCQAGHGML